MRNMVWVALCSALVAACGGGGGDSGSTTPVATLAITSTNQDGVARAATSATTSVGTASGGLTGTSGGAVSLGAVSKRVAFALENSRKATLSAQPLAITSDTYDCSYDGTVTLTVDNANNNSAVDNGDSLTFTFNNCKETANDNANGTLAITLNSYTSGSFTGTMAFNLTATDGTRSAVVTGSVGVSYSVLSSTSSRIDMTVGSNGLSSTVTAGGVPESLTYESGFTISETDTSTGSSLTIAGGIQSSVLAGRIVIATPTAIVQSTGALYPSSGQLLVTGTSGSALRITVLSSTQIQLELDADGNGTFDNPVVRNWSTVLPS